MTNEEKRLQSVRCAGCGEFLQAGRRNLRFHGSACRSRFWRWQRDIKLHSAMMQSYIANWQQLAAVSICTEDIRNECIDILRTMSGLVSSTDLDIAMPNMIDSGRFG